MTTLEPSQQGTIPFQIPVKNIPGETFYKVFGDLDNGTPPLLILHGGPGVGHNYILPFAELWSLYRIPVIMYDQIGCGESTHLRDTIGDKSLWIPSTFIAELENVVEHFKLARPDGPGFDVLGHSWGGRLAGAYAVRQPVGLRRLIIAGASASTDLFKESIWAVTKELPAETQKAISDAVEKNDFTGKAYIDARTKFMMTFLCRADPQPDILVPPNPDPTVRETMQGKSPWVYDGSLAGYSSIPELHKIQATTLLYYGEFDTTRRPPMMPFFNLVPKVRMVEMKGASHMSHLDTPELKEKTMQLVGEFLCS